MESRFLSITNDIEKRIDDVAKAGQVSCQINAKINQEVSSKIDNFQQDNEARFNNMERELLRNELMLTGVPASYGEVVLDIISDICNVLHSNINGGDIVSAYRLPPAKTNMGRHRNGRSSDISSPIIVRLASDWAKQDFISAYFKKKDLNVRDIGYQSNARIYVNESLTKHNKAIFKVATEAKKARTIYKCYTRNGIVHIQPHEEGKIFRVSCIDHLNAIISSNLQKSTPTGPVSAGNAPMITDESTEVSQTKTTTIPESSTAVHDGVPGNGQ